MMNDCDRYDIDWSRLTPAEAEIVREFAASLQQVREEATMKLQLFVYKLELLCEGMATLHAEQMSPDSPFWREVEERIGHASFFRPTADGGR
jgi:hypothetical protein